MTNTLMIGYVNWRECGLMADRASSPAHSLKANSYPL